MVNVKIVRTGLAGFLLLCLGVPAPEVLAEMDKSAPSEVSGSAELDPVPPSRCCLRWSTCELERGGEYNPHRGRDIVVIWPVGSG